MPPTLNLARVDPGMLRAEAEGGGGEGGAQFSCRRGEVRAGAARGDDEQFRVRGDEREPRRRRAAAGGGGEADREVWGGEGGKRGRGMRREGGARRNVWSTC